MNTIKLNTIGDSPVVVKKGSQVQSQEKTVEITENGTTEVVPDSGFSLSKVTVNTNVESSGSATKWTGHADAEGLKAIGWTDEDVAYYQANGVNWNEEDDEYHKVTDDNKALYGVLTADNISTYKDRIVYLPKIDTSGISIDSLFMNCKSLISIPLLDTSAAITVANAFRDCHSLVCIPPLVFTSARAAGNCFYNCYSLTHIPDLDLSNAKTIDSIFYNCYSLVTFSKIKFSIKVGSNRPNFNSICSNCYSLVDFPSTENTVCGAFMSAFDKCYSLKKIGVLDMSYADYGDAVMNTFDYCNSLETAYLKNVSYSIKLTNSSLLSKESLLYIINNEAATRAITITLAAYAYTRLAEDADVVAALANHPNISLASA